MTDRPERKGCICPSGFAMNLSCPVHRPRPPRDRPEREVEGLVETIRDAEAVEVKTTEYAKPGTLYALDPKAATSVFWPSSYADQTVYVICHPEDEATAHEFVNAARRTDTEGGDDE